MEPLMNIVLLADNRKTELLANFCIAYRKILNKHTLISALNTGKIIQDSSGLNVTSLPTEIRGTIEQLASRALYNEIDAVIFLRDPERMDTAPNSLLRACDVNTIPYATNMATAEILVLAIDRGDLEWRELIR